MKLECSVGIGAVSVKEGVAMRAALRAIREENTKYRDTFVTLL
jgi:hypothetical protein